MRVGVVGLGAIGSIAASNLIRAGFEVTVWNRSPEPVQALAAQGAIPAENAGQVLQSCEIVLSFLFDDSAVREVFLESGALNSVPPGIIHVCMSTISTEMVQELIAAHAAHGIEYAAAPFFGRPEAAGAAKLNIVTGGTPELLDKIEPVLGVLGETWWMGDNPQAGHLAKIAGNFLLGCAVEAMQESAEIMSSHGADPAPFLRMMGETLLSAPVYRTAGPAIAAGEYARTPTTLRIALKDISLALNEASKSGIQVPFAEAILDRMKKIPS